MVFAVTSLQQTTTRRSLSLSKGLLQEYLVVVGPQSAKTKSTIISSFRAAAHGLTGAGPPYVAAMAVDGSVTTIAYKNPLRRRVCSILLAR